MVLNSARHLSDSDSSGALTSLQVVLIVLSVATVLAAVGGSVLCWVYLKKRHFRGTARQPLLSSSTPQPQTYNSHGTFTERSYPGEVVVQVRQETAATARRARGSICVPEIDTASLRLNLVHAMESDDKGNLLLGWYHRRPCVVKRFTDLPQSPAGRQAMAAFAAYLVQVQECLRDQMLPVWAIGYQADQRDALGRHVGFCAVMPTAVEAWFSNLRKHNIKPFASLLNLATIINRLHAQGLVHGCIKPNNVLTLPHNSETKMVVADCGLHLLSSEWCASKTPEYCAPELHSPGAKATAAADVYAFAQTVVTVLNNGLHPWAAAPRLDVLRFQASDNRIDIPHSTPAALIPVLQQALSSSPSERPPMSTFINILSTSVPLGMGLTTERLAIETNAPLWTVRPLRIPPGLSPVTVDSTAVIKLVTLNSGWSEVAADAVAIDMPGTYGSLQDEERKEPCVQDARGPLDEGVSEIHRKLHVTPTDLRGCHISRTTLVADNRNMVKRYTHAVASHLNNYPNASCPNHPNYPGWKTAVFACYDTAVRDSEVAKMKRFHVRSLFTTAASNLYDLQPLNAGGEGVPQIYRVYKAFTSWSAAAAFVKSPCKTYEDSSLLGRGFYFSSDLNYVVSSAKGTNPKLRIIFVTVCFVVLTNPFPMVEDQGQLKHLPPPPPHDANIAILDPVTDLPCSLEMLTHHSNNHVMVVKDERTIFPQAILEVTSND